ncbi:MAG: LysE family translocator [Steroidobacteraceae bacterium]
MHLTTWLAFVATAAIVVVIPGPTILTVIGYSLTHGRRAQLALVAAVALGDCTSLTFSMLGLGALLAVSAFWFTVVKVAGGLYLLYLAARMAWAGFAAQPMRAVETGSMHKVFGHTWLVTALNPKAIVFFVAFLPQFVDPGQPAAPQLWILAVSYVVLAIINASLYAWFAAVACRLLSSARAQRRFNLSGAALLSAAGVWALLRKGPTS